METYGSGVQEGRRQPVDTDPVVLRTSDATLALKERNSCDRRGSVSFPSIERLSTDFAHSDRSHSKLP